MFCLFRWFFDNLSFPVCFYIKVSEYPFKQNKNMLKSMTVLLYTNFYIFLYVLRPAFFNTYMLLHIVITRSKRGGFWSTSELALRFNFFHIGLLNFFTLVHSYYILPIKCSVVLDIFHEALSSDLHLFIHAKTSLTNQ